MSSLSSSEVHAVLEALDRLYMPVDLADFPQHLIEVIGALVPNILTTFDVVHPNPAKCVNIQSLEVTPEWKQRCAELMPVHPSVVYIQNGGTEQVIRITDFLTHRQFRRTQIYDELFRPAGVGYQIAVILPAPAGVAGLALNRDKEFSEEERRSLQLLRSHILRAYELCAIRNEKSEAKSFTGGEVQRWARKRGLTKREAEVLYWIAEGKRDKEIALIIGSSPRTIQKHAASIFNKLGVENRTSAAAEWRRHQ